jgi:hypothetical protein
MKATLTLFIAVMVLTAAAQDQFSTRRIAVFKNGTGFFVKNGQINAPGGKYTLPFTPDALFGTIWFNAGNDRISSIQTSDEKSVEKKDVASLYDLLKGNVGKKAKVTTQSGEIIDGSIESVSPMLLTVKTKDAWFTSSPDQVRSVQFIDKPDMMFSESTGKNRLMLQFASAGSKNVDLMYLQKGISWVPEYLIELLDDKNAILSLRAVLVNDAEDLLNASISFVVGVPNFKYSNIIAPLCSSESLTSFLSSLTGYGPTGATGRFDNFMSNANVAQSYSSYNESQLTTIPSYDFSTEGTGTEDLFFYDLKDITLKKGGRGSYEVLNTKLPFEHIYEVELDRNSDVYFYGKAAYDNTIKNSVWHSIKFANGSKIPFTTGAAMVVSRENNTISPVSQDMMKYVPVNGEGFLKITVSPDINVKDKEIETSRQPKVKKQGTQYYDLITVEGKIKVKNFRDKEVKLNIKREIFGELKTCDITWKHVRNVKNYSYSGSINPSNNVDWVINLKSGEEKEFTYTYTFYVYS